MSSKKVLVEEQRYGSVDGGESTAQLGMAAEDAELLSPGSLSRQSSGSFSSSLASDDDPYAWVKRLQNVPDKVASLAILKGWFQDRSSQRAE